MDNLYIVIIVCMFILTACEAGLETRDKADNESIIVRESADDEDENISDLEITKSVSDNMESILYYENLESIEHADKSKYDLISFFVDTDTSRNESIIESYLIDRGMYEDYPDGDIYYNEQVLGEYYINEDLGKISFILHIWNFHSESPKRVAISCLTVNINDFNDEGYFVYQYDGNQDIVQEDLYSVDNNLLASVIYEHIADFPFSIIVEHNENVDDDRRMEASLNRNQKLWLYKDYIETDNTGNITGYNGDPFYRTDCDDYLVFNYNDNDEVVQINGLLTDNESLSENHTFSMDFNYGENHLLNSITYSRSTRVYGTSDSIGDVLYDDEGRMVYNDFYVTHGSMYCFYFYKSNEIRPWAIITLDSMPYNGWEEDGIVYMYGNYINTYLFLKK